MITACLRKEKVICVTGLQAELIAEPLSGSDGVREAQLFELFAETRDIDI